MDRRMAWLALLFTAGLMALPGCASGARYVTQTSTGGVVAIPSNSNSWPNHYVSQAEELMKAQCPDGYIIESQGEYVTGTTQFTDTTTNRKSTAVLTDLGIVPEKVDQHQTTSFQNHTEWRIYYRRKDAPPGSSPAPEGQPPAVQPVLMQSAVGLTPTSSIPATPSPVLSTPYLPSGRN